MAETRALSAALAGPAFTTRAGGLAMHVANRHVERWAPEPSGGAGARRRPGAMGAMGALGFVDRLVAPWMETAQRSVGLRMFSGYLGTPAGVPGNEREPTPVSWVFPRPWYGDELDWMAAARHASQQAAMEQAAPAMLTTRGTYVPRATAMPSAMYEYIAPSLSVAPAVARPDVYSPLVPLAAVQAAHVMARAMAPLIAMSQAGATAGTGTRGAAATMTGLRGVLSSMLDRVATQPEPVATRWAGQAPEMVTPPAPRADDSSSSAAEAAPVMSAADSIGVQLAEQRARVADLQRVTQLAAVRSEPQLRAMTEVVEARRAVETARESQKAATAAQAQAQVVEAAQGARRVDERRSIDERVAQRIAERAPAARLHEQARTDAARDALVAPVVAVAPAAATARGPDAAAVQALGAALAAVSPELAALVAARPERAVHTIAEIHDALRSAELLARSAASGVPFETTRGPRLTMPSGLGGLVSTLAGAGSPRATSEAFEVPAMSAARSAPRVPALWSGTFVAPVASRALDRTALHGALASAAAHSPAALGHVAWADRWLARFSGANPASLATLSLGSRGSSVVSVDAAAWSLAGNAPSAVFVAPDAEATEPRAAAAAPTAIVRYDDDAETPDDVFAQISASASRTRGPASVAAPIETPAIRALEQPRQTFADALAHTAPSAPGAGMAAQLAASPFAPALRHVLPLAPTASFDVRALFGGALSATYLAGLFGSDTREISAAGGLGAFDTAASIGSTGGLATTFAEREVAAFEPAYVTPMDEPAPGPDPMPVESARASAALERVTTLRTALLSFEVDVAGSRATSSPASSARALVEATAQPILDVMPAQGTWAAPGMVADRAQAWSVANERSSSDLSFDFVTPELVLAARVYGLGPAEAAQAVRLAIAGPGQLAAMATAVDRTFIQAMALDGERRTQSRASGSRDDDVVTSAPRAETAPSFAATTGAAFGVERRAPRGSFTWPAATVGALGMTAAAPDGELSMSVAALELLAARAVAELGTYAALVSSRAGSGAPVAALASATTSPASSPASIDMPTLDTVDHEADIITSAAALVPTARRARFDALYVALGQTAQGKSWSPAARAARALALAGRGEDTPVSARDRAAAAWDVLPVVYATADADEPHALTTSTGARAAASTSSVLGRARATELPQLSLDGRPGLGSLSARAGEALDSYVAPPSATMPQYAQQAASSAPVSMPVVTSAASRAPTAAPELVRTGRPSGRHGGGEVEIPSWFEAAARKMLDDRSGASDGISMAELTLVNAAPSSHVAASSRSAPSASPSMPTPDSAAGPITPHFDVEKIAHEVYHHILVLMDSARARNGEPYL